MKKSIFFAVVFSTMSILISCTSFSIKKDEGFTHVKNVDNFEFYKYTGDYRNTCDCILGKKAESTMLLCLSNIEIFKDFTSMRKRAFIKVLQNKLTTIKYQIDEFDNRIAFAEIINKPIKQISNDYLLDHFTELAKFTTNYDVILEEMIRTIYEEE